MRYVKGTIKIAVLTMIAAIITSCRNDFDFEKAYISYNERLSSYTETFESVFGKIDPDQEWDFSGVGKEEGTRAKRANQDPNWKLRNHLVKNGSIIDDNGSASSPTRTDNDLWYEVPKKLKDWLKINLQETRNNTDKAEDDFKLIWTSKKFLIIPIYQGRASDWDLYLQMPDRFKDGSSTTYSQNYPQNRAADYNYYTDKFVDVATEYTQAGGIPVWTKSDIQVNKVCTTHTNFDDVADNDNAYMRYLDAIAILP